MAGSGGGAVGGAMAIGPSIGAVSAGAVHGASSVGHTNAAHGVQAHQSTNKVNGLSHTSNLSHTTKVGTHNIANPMSSIGNQLNNINSTNHSSEDSSVNVSSQGMKLSQELSKITDDLVALALLAILEKDQKNNNPIVSALTTAMAVQMYQDVSKM